VKSVVLVGLLLAAFFGGVAMPADSVCFGASPPEQRGLVLPTWERNGYAGNDTDVALGGISSVGAGWVQIVPTWYQPTRTSSQIGPAESTVTDDGVRRVVGLARRHGLKIFLKPHVDSADGSQRVSIVPNDRAAWYESYRAFITHYADLARELGVDEFAVGTELRELSGDRDQWLAVIREVRNRYAGTITYAANHDEYRQVGFWDAVDVIGIDAYWPISPQPTADVAQLEAGLIPIRDELADFAVRTHRRILFTEAGYASQVGSVTEPWHASPSGEPAGDEQAAAYEALLRTFTGQPWWAGVFWWTWNVQHDYHVETPRAVSYPVQGKPAESVLRTWWATASASRRESPVGE
jgi:hypothetical protein